ncbi:AfsR/SARP family transcriptional regulator [Nocardiopsis potens]|uniref:AfsR/SARP family transcriptional regulator n=1 Tax=Nocardiopsis potens TaxID=1246458 RepID=UPI0003465DF3|nr:BTAD domain-containing putative transcriptional regulator [Nocardiopsis potens]
MQISVLGSLDVTVDGTAVEVSGKEMLLLVSLALSTGRPVAPEVLADRLWDGAVGGSWRPTLHTYVTRLRRRLAGAGVPRSRIRQASGGYVLALASEDVDWARFQELRTRGSATLGRGDRDAGLRLLEEALALWRGEPLPGLTGRWIESIRPSMRGAHQTALVSWAQNSLRAGLAEQAVERLGEASSAYPLNESLAELLMRALHQAGRTADALDHFHLVRERLAETTGSDPHPRLVRAHREILRSRPDPAGGGSAPPPSGPPPAESGPSLRSPAAVATNLPRDLADFSDRTAETERILGVLTSSAVPTAARVCVLSGMPGVGKTSLAVHAAHRLAGEFPDGRLMLELRGHHEHREPLTPFGALGELLQLVGVGLPEDEGASLNRRVAVWRDYTARRRMLIVLDDAAGAEQVLPLLPAGAGCAVLVTGRNSLPDIDGARHIRLQVPAPGDAVTVFTRMAAREQTSEGAETAARIVELCGQLPLAMRLIATRLDTRADLVGSRLIDRLRAAGDRVGEFRAGSRRLSTVFDVSLRSLGGSAQTALLRLGLHPSPVVDRDVAAAMVGLDPAETEDALEELEDASLIDTDPGSGGHRLHSLVMNHAHRRARTGLPLAEQHAVRSRMLDAYLSVCTEADRLLYPDRLRLDRFDRTAGPTAPFLPPPPRDKAAAMELLNRRLPVVLDVVHHSARTDHDREAALLADTVAEHVYAHGPWEAAVPLHSRSLGIWRGRGDTEAEAHATYQLSRAYLRMGDRANAERCAREALSLWQNHGEATGLAWTRHQLGLISFVGGDYRTAARLHEEAQEEFERAGHKPGIALSLDRRGACHFRDSDFHAAISAHSDALRLQEQEQISSTATIIDTKIHLAGAFQGLGYHREATKLCQEALWAAQEIGDQRREGAIATNLGEISSYKGETGRAFSFFGAALDTLRELHDFWTEVVTLTNLAHLHLKCDELDKAEAHFKESSRLCATYGTPGTSVEILIGMGEIELIRGHLESAYEHFTRALNEAVQADLRRERGLALTALGRTLAQKGMKERAQSRFEAAERILSEISAPEAVYAQILIYTLASPSA